MQARNKSAQRCKFKHNVLEGRCLRELSFSALTPVHCILETLSFLVCFKQNGITGLLSW